MDDACKVGGHTWTDGQMPRRMDMSRCIEGWRMHQMRKCQTCMDGLRMHKGGAWTGHARTGGAVSATHALPTPCLRWRRSRRGTDLCVPVLSCPVLERVCARGLVCARHWQAQDAASSRTHPLAHRRVASTGKAQEQSVAVASGTAVGRNKCSGGWRRDAAACCGCVGRRGCSRRRGRRSHMCG
eukprot:356917-Chlamydomonas_euryale.AAC.5